MTVTAWRALRSHLAVLEALSHAPTTFARLAAVLSGIHERTLRAALGSGLGLGLGLERWVGR